MSRLKSEIGKTQPDKREHKPQQENRGHHSRHDGESVWAALRGAGKMRTTRTEERTCNDGP